MDRIRFTDETRAIHSRMNQTLADYPSERSVQSLFQECAERHSNNIAVSHEGRSLSYHELNGLANALAARLRRGGVEPGAVVGVSVARSAELIIALLAVLKCGATYLPFDAAWPAMRLGQLFARARCTCLMSDRPSELAKWPGRYTIFAVDRSSMKRNRSNIQVEVPSQSIAYINFTSGSTGEPKGVPVQHRSIARLVFGASYAPLSEQTRLLQLAPATFDAATFEIWGALLHGGTCVIYPAQRIRISHLNRVLETNAVNTLFLTTALFNTLIDESPQSLRSQRTILTGGEIQSGKHMREALRTYGPDRVVHVYGPTECTTFATCYPLRDIGDDQTVIPIGRPIQNTRLYLIDDERLCLPGEVGEICLAGPGLSPGYLSMPEVTRQYFI
jgi:D-alanine--poly(phosphoribitol) ligase subunit 1